MIGKGMPINQSSAPFPKLMVASFSAQQRLRALRVPNGAWRCSEGHKPSIAFAGLVWTNLPARFNGRDGVAPSEEEVIGYLLALEGEARDRAEAYIRNAPNQVDTAYRKRIVTELGWTPVRG